MAMGKDGYDRKGTGHFTDSALESWEWLVEQGEHPERAAARVGWSLTALEKAARERDKRKADAS